jgi:dihydrofolate reductase
MAKLIYSAITSLDGYVADEDGKFDWAEPDQELHAFGNDLERPIGSYLYGRRMYEVMVAWENPELLAHEQPVIRDFAGIWQAADRSSTRRRWRRCPASGRRSSGSSTLTRSGS